MWKVLLIDDSKTQLDVLRMKFLKHDFEVETANNAIEGYHKIFEFVPDVVLSDIMMPDLDGYQFCRLLKNNQTTKNIPVILLTVLDKKIDKFWGEKSGAVKFISKTAEFEEIKEEVLAIIKKMPLLEEDKENIAKAKIDSKSLQDQINNILNELLMESTFLNEFRNLGEFCTHEKALVQESFNFLSSFIDYNIGGLFFHNNDGNEKYILYLDMPKNQVSTFIIEKIKRDFFAQMPNLKPFSISDFTHEKNRENQEESSTRLVAIDELQTKFILPLIFEGKLLGGICFYSKEKVDYKAFKFYNLMISELYALFKIKYLYSEIEFLSVTDGLTGLYNRRHFEYNIEREFLRSKRYSGDLSLAILDLDFFKNINDTYGHQYGDYVLKEVAKMLKDSFRKTDMIFRYGGEELAVILTETSLKNSTIPMDRFREKIENYVFSYKGIEAKLTVSIGLSANYENFDKVDMLVESADKALYQAKTNGRNKTVVYINEQFDS